MNMNEYFHHGPQKVDISFGGWRTTEDGKINVVEIVTDIEQIKLLEHILSVGEEGTTKSTYNVYFNDNLKINNINVIKNIFTQLKKLKIKNV